MNKQDKEIKAEEMETISGGPHYTDFSEAGSQVGILLGYTTMVHFEDVLLLIAMVLSCGWVRGQHSKTNEYNSFSVIDPASAGLSFDAKANQAWKNLDCQFRIPSCSERVRVCGVYVKSKRSQQKGRAHSV